MFTLTTSRFAPFVLLAGLTLLAGGATGGVAQEVQGVVLDEARGRPLPGATLRLFDDAGVPVDSATADRAGRFRLTAPTPGPHFVVFQLDGWATVPSNPLDLATGHTTAFEFRVPLVSAAALRQMGDILRMEPWLQEALPEICGEEFRPWEAGLLVGVVRVRATREPLAGARVAVATAAGGTTRSTVSNERGVYVLCNVPVGPAVSITAEAPDGARETIEVEIRPGTASWYDLPLGPRRR
jgi:hypothetical protein